MDQSILIIKLLLQALVYQIVEIVMYLQINYTFAVMEVQMPIF